MATKLNTIKKHFRKRMNERFGIKVVDSIINTLIKQIKTNKAKLLYKESLSKSCFKVKYDDIEFAVIYSKKYKTFITAIPLDWALETQKSFI